MDGTANPPSAKNAISVLDPELPFLAAQAAIELDRLRLGESKETGSVVRLGELITNSTSKVCTTERLSLMDPTTISVINDAIAISSARAPRTLPELVNEAADIAAQMEKLSEQQDTQIDRVRRFCVALSQKAAAFQRSIRDTRPSHPYRR